MEITQIIGNDFIGICKIESKESMTIAYNLTVFPIVFEIVKGNQWNYNEISISISPLIQISINTL